MPLQANTCSGSGGAQRLHPVCGQVAQSVEQRIENPRVGGSIPSLATIQINGLHVFAHCKPFCFV